MAGLTVHRLGSPLAYFSFTIASGAAVSDALDTHGMCPVAIITPATWTTANLTFQGTNISTGTYADVYDDAGTEYNVAASTSRYILLNPSAFASFQYIKVRSGTTGTPVLQGGARTVVMMLRKLHRVEGS